MKISAIISFLICVLPTGTCTAYQLIGTEALSKELVAQHYTINPRLDAVIVVDRTSPTFEYHTYYGAGSADEAEGKQGRLHFLQHIMSDTGSHEYGKLNQIIIENGGGENASTSSHFMRFTMRFPKDKFDLAVEIDRDRYYNTAINEEVVEKDKKIILTERSGRMASLTRRSANYFFSLIYGKKNFNSLGAEDFLKQLEPGDLKDYYENFLRHQKRLVVVIGDVDVDHVLTKLDEAYGNEQIPDELSSKSPAPHDRNYELLGKKIKRTSKNLSFTIFRKGWYIPNLGHRDYAGLHILERILEKPSNSLRSSLIDSGLAKSFSVSINSYKGFGLMNCYAELPHETSSNTLHAMIQSELEKLKSISEAELNAARNQQLTTMYSTFYNRLSMASSFGQAFAHTNDPLLYPKLIKDLKSIRREDIPRIINQHLMDYNSITHSLTVPETKKSPPRTPLAYGIVVLACVGLLTLLGCLVALLVWGGKKMHRKFSRKANEYVSESDA